VELLRVTFPVSGSEIPLDHGYAVFSAISGLVPEIHANRQVAIAPIRGVFKAPTTLTLAPFSRLTVITPLTLVPDLFVLSGKLLTIGGSPVLLGRMVLTPIEPCGSVGSRLVVFSFPNGLEINEENFGTEVGFLAYPPEEVYSSGQTARAPSRARTPSGRKDVSRFIADSSQCRVRTTSRPAAIPATGSIQIEFRT